MKKTLTTAAVAIALVTAGIGAYATKVAHAPKTDDPVYRWTKTGQPGFFDGTLANAQSEYNCLGENVPCAQGSLISGDGPETALIYETE